VKGLKDLNEQKDEKAKSFKNKAKVRTQLKLRT